MMLFGVVAQEWYPSILLKGVFSLCAFSLKARDTISFSIGAAVAIVLLMLKKVNVECHIIGTSSYLYSIIEWPICFQRHIASFCKNKKHFLL